MSRDVYHNITKKLTRSNSHENIPLRPMATLIHSKPTSHGAGEMSFGARDDGLSSNKYVTSSPYEYTSSALAVRPYKFVFLSIYHSHIHYRYSVYYLYLL
jgi:hypothetical protein